MWQACDQDLKMNLSKDDQIILAEIFERVGNGSRDEIKYELETKKSPPH
jgi:predicted  nucleic acid-binding Zn ribbon protein